MAKKWTEVIQSPEYQSLSSSEKQEAQSRYFIEVVSPRVPKGERKDALNAFYQEFPVQSDPTEGMSGTQKFLAGAGKAFVDAGRGINQMTTGLGMGGAGLTVEGQPTDPDSARYYTSELQREKDIQAEIDQSRIEDAPLMRTGAGIAGNVAGNIAIAAPAMAVPGANTVLGAGLTGTVLGASQPVASDESRLLNTTIGGLAGAGTSAILKGLGKALMPSLKQSEATKKILQALRRDKIRPDELAQRLKDLGPDATLADVGGENLRALARSTASLPGPGKEIAASALSARQAGQSGRVSQQISKSLGAGELFYQNVDDLVAARAQNAAPLYEKVVKASNRIPRRQFSPIKNDEFISDIIRKVKSDPLYKMGGMSDDSLPVIDQSKKYIDRMIASAKRGNNPNNYEISKLVEKSNKLKDIADEAFPGYKRARDAFAGPSQLINALEEGKSFLRGDAEITKAALSKLPESEQQFFRIGVARALRDRVLNTPDTADAVKKMMNTPLIRDKLKVVFPNMKSFRDFEKVLEREAKFFATKSAVLSGSRTAPLAAEMSDAVGSAVDWGRIGMDATRGNFGSAALGAIRKIRGPGNLSPEVSEELGKSLFGQGDDLSRTVFRLGEQPKQLPSFLTESGSMVRGYGSPAMPVTAYRLSQD